MAQKHHSLTRLSHAPTLHASALTVLRALALTALHTLAVTALLSGCSLFSSRPTPPGTASPNRPLPAPPAAGSSQLTPPSPTTPQHAPAQPPRENSLSPATRSLVTQAK